MCVFFISQAFGADARYTCGPAGAETVIESRVTCFNESRLSAFATDAASMAVNKSGMYFIIIVLCAVGLKSNINV